MVLWRRVTLVRQFVYFSFVSVLTNVVVHACVCTVVSAHEFTIKKLAVTLWWNKPGVTPTSRSPKSQQNIMKH